LNILQKIFYGLVLLFIPLAIILDKIVGVPQPLLFFLAAVAIFLLAALLVHTTETLATTVAKYLQSYAAGNAM
jgi:Ca2+/H+ antiporter